MEIKVTLKSGIEVDLALSLPLTIGDLRKVHAAGVEPAKADAGDVETTLKLVEIIIRKSYPDITLDDLDSIPLRSMQDLLVAVKTDGKPDPTT